MGNAWPLVRGHELMSALQDVMGFTPLLMFYPEPIADTISPHWRALIPEIIIAPSGWYPKAGLRRH
jgi:hypothetical protein